MKGRLFITSLTVSSVNCVLRFYLNHSAILMRAKALRNLSVTAQLITDTSWRKRGPVPYLIIENHFGNVFLHPHGSIRLIIRMHVVIAQYLA